MIETIEAGVLAKAYEPSAIEEKWAKFWAEERLFDAPSPVEAGDHAAFTMLLPPPNVTGFLHMGHMFEHAESDILVRWHRMRGEQALWVPGTDHAGIATQMLVERALTKEGVTRQELGREAFVARVWDWKKQYGGGIKSQMLRLGDSVDWSREYFTMDERLSTAVVEAFVRLHEQGLIYRGAYIVNWDPVLETAVSDLEVTHEDRVGKIYHIRYMLAGGAMPDGTDSITIATTRPETLLGDTAVAVNPTDERYRHLIGMRLVLPLVGREIPVVGDDWANPEFGTGAVKVTPAHDPNDFAIGQRHKLPSLSILTKQAKIDVPGSPYDGLDRYAARERIVADLEAQGALAAVKDHAMSVGLSQRSGSVIEPRLSEQWFLAVTKTPAGGESIAGKAIAAVRDGHIRITPEMYAKTYNEWMGNIHDWCLSRQLWWGHRIPAWHCAACREVTVARTAPAFCKACGRSELTQDPDVLDTWFSSGLLPFTVFGWPAEDGKPTPDMAAFYPTDLLVTGFDILFFWVARMIMLGTHFMADVPMPDGTARGLQDAVPFREVYIHGLIRDAGGEKMSKTKGNVIDPIEIIRKFGTDAVRFTLASQASPGSDIPLNEDRTDGYRAFANKIWNAARFLFMNFDRAHEAGIALDATELAGALQLEGVAAAAMEDRWILSRLASTAAEVDRALKNYRFDEAAAAVYQFFWGELCDWYLEIVKLRLDFVGEGQVQTRVALTTFTAVFEAALRMLSPFMPFITEEIWHALLAHPAFGGQVEHAKSIALTRYPQVEDMAFDQASVDAMATLQEAVVTVRGVRKELGVPEKETAPIRVFGAGPVGASIAADAPILAKLARVSAVEVAADPLTGVGARSTPKFDVEVVYAREIDVPAERERLTKELAKLEKGLTAAERQLGNEAFMAKAPAHIVEGLRKQEAETRGLYEKAKAALTELG